MENLYCKLFVDCDRSLDALEDLVAKQARRELDFDIQRNDEFDPNRRSDFLFSRYYFDIEPAPRTEESDYVAAVASLVEDLRKSGCRAVAACDFEDALPKA